MSWDGALLTGHKQRFIEIVPNCESEARIQMALGAKGALSETVIEDFLRKHNPDEQFERACQIFALSCAGYAAATFILGIGDGHPDNVLIQRDGHFCISISDIYWGITKLSRN
jgi:phosphatidylinositol-4,5-bisphosphate 3-kinase